MSGFLPSEWFSGDDSSSEYRERLAKAQKNLTRLRESKASAEAIAEAEQEREKWIDKLSRL